MRYEKHNLNPKNKKVGDCVVRTIAGFTGKDYRVVYDDLCIKNSLDKDFDAWIKELEGVSTEVFLSCQKMNGEFELGIVIYSGEPSYSSVDDVMRSMLALLMEGMEEQ